MRLAARLIIEDAPEGEAADALGRGSHARGAAPEAGYRDGCRTGRLKSAEGSIELPCTADRRSRYAAPGSRDTRLNHAARLAGFACGERRAAGRP
jgi:hypothetical protein